MLLALQAQTLSSGVLTNVEHSCHDRDATALHVAEISVYSAMRGCHVVTVGNEEQRQARKNQVSEEERLLVSAVQFLIDGHEEDAANVLLSCSLRVWETGDTQLRRAGLYTELSVTVVGPRAAYDILRDTAKILDLDLAKMS